MARNPLPTSTMDALSIIRKKFAQEVAVKPELYHPVDIKRVETEDWQIERYLLDSNNNDSEFSEACIEIAFKNMLETLQLKKELDIHDIDWSYFPTEFIQFYMIEIHGRDKDGRMIIWDSMRNRRMFAEYLHIFKQLIVFSIEQIDRQAGKDGFIYCCDQNQIGLENVDLGIARFSVEVVGKHFPLGIKKMIFIDVPFFIKPFMKLAISFMNDAVRSTVCYLSKDQLKQIIDADFIPEHLNGNRTQKYYPDNLKSLRDIHKELNLTSKDVDTYFNYYKNKMHLIKY